MKDLEKYRAKCREATRRYRAKKARGETIKHAIPAPSGIELWEIPGFSDHRADDQGNLYTRLPIGKPKFEDGPHVPWRVQSMQFEPRQKYLTVRIKLDGEQKRKRVLVHKLIALAFLGARPKGMQIAHGVKGSFDNSPGNLSYKTPAQNKADEIRDGTRYEGDRHHAVILKSSKWPELQRRWNAGVERKSDLCREFGISRTTVHRRLKRSTIYDFNDAAFFDAVLFGGGIAGTIT